MRTRLLVALPLLVGLAGLAGCGRRQDGSDGIASATGKGATPASSASGGPVSPEQAEQDALTFARCMRAHGVNMPDPKTNGRGGIGITINGKVPKAAVDAAQKACKQYLPNGGEPPKMDPKDVEALRKMAQCMRENGVPTFPDPSPGGGIQITPGMGVDPDSSVFQAAQKKCDQYAPQRPGGGRGASDSGPVTSQNGG